MRPSRPLITRPIEPPPPPPICFTKNCKLKRVFASNINIKFPLITGNANKCSRNQIQLPASTHSSSPVLASKLDKREAVEENIEKVSQLVRLSVIISFFFLIRNYWEFYYLRAANLLLLLFFFSAGYLSMPVHGTSGCFWVFDWRISLFH